MLMENWKNENPSIMCSGEELESFYPKNSVVNELIHAFMD